MAVDLQDLSRRLFQAASQLWTNTALRPDQYAQPVLALIALRQMEAIFDLLTTSEPKLTKAQEQEVKRVAQGLLEKLQGLVDAVDWMRARKPEALSGGPSRWG